MKRSLEQIRAKYAFDIVKKRVKDFEGENKKRERYLTMAKSLPATIIMCGLGQTTATLLSVGKEEKDNPDRMLYEDLENWLCNNQEGGIYQEKDLIKAIVKNDRNKYIKAQVEALKLLEWLKKFATAYLSKEGDKT
jgi:CRISPR-associated protein Cmr5